MLGLASNARAQSYFADGFEDGDVFHINAVDANGETAMHGAAYRNAPRAAAFLADRAADVAGSRSAEGRS